jgi:hypothetical protein
MMIHRALELCTPKGRKQLDKLIDEIKQESEKVVESLKTNGVILDTLKTNGVQIPSVHKEHH